MLPFELSQADFDTVKIERKNHTNQRVRTRLWILWLLHKGFSRSETADLVSCSADTITNTVKVYNAERLPGLLKAQQGKAKQKHPLRKKFDKVRNSLLQASIHTVAQAQKHLSDKFNYQAGWESVRQLLHRLGLGYRKINPFPGNPKKFDEWILKQKDWIVHLNALHHRALTREIDFVFGDAAHFVHGKCGAYLWSDGPRYKSTGSGRYRLNVYGAYDPISNRLLSQYSSDNVDADYVVDFLRWLRQNHYLDLSRPLHFVLDNARYQHCDYVKSVAQQLNIVLQFQPSYSPNLNLIERAWKYFKKLVGRTYYTSKEEFFKSITDILEATDESHHQDSFKTLLTMNFQTYEKSEILGC